MPIETIESEKRRLIHEYNIGFRSRNQSGKSLEGLMIDMATHSPRLFEITYHENASDFLIKRQVLEERIRVWKLRHNIAKT